MAGRYGEPFPYGSIMVMETWSTRKDEQGNVVFDANGQYVRDALQAIFVQRKEPGFGEAYGVQRHARATHARVTLAAPNGGVMLRIEDDGIGPGSRGDASTGHGFGLIGLRERVALFGGQLDFGPGRHAGACLSVTLPLEALP